MPAFYLTATPFQPGTVVQGSSDTLARRWLRESSALREKGQYTLALDTGLKALKLSQSTGNRSLAAESELQIAQLYMYLGEQDSRKDHIRQGLQYAKQANWYYADMRDTAGWVLGRNVEGILFRSYAKLGDSLYYDSAITCYSHALAMIESSGKSRQYIGVLYNNISQYYTEYKHDYPAALRYLQQAVQANLEQNKLHRLSYNYGNISYAYMLIGNRALSLEYANKMLDHARQSGNSTRILNAYKQLYDSYYTFGPADSSLRYHLLYDALQDSITGVEVNRQITEIQTKYETARNKELIEKLHIRNSEQHKKILFLTLGVTLLLLLLLLLFWLYRRVRHQKSLIARQSGQLDIIMRELHHRVKNNLQIVMSLLSLQSYRLQDKEALDAIRLSQQRVRAMSFIHQRLYIGENSQSVNMEEYLGDLARSLITAYGFADGHFDLQLQVSEKWLDVDKALPVGLIANEIITNALKYAYAGEAHPALGISLNRENDHYILEIRDNGGHWNEQQWWEASQSFGRQLVSSLCVQLNATEALTMDKGAVFTFTIPRENAG